MHILTITVEEDEDNNKKKEIKNYFSRICSISCTSKINNTFIDNAEGLDIVMSMYNLLEYNGNYLMTSGSLWDYFRDEINDDVNENNAAKTG